MKQWSGTDVRKAAKISSLLVVPTIFLGGFPGHSVVKNQPVNAGDECSIPGWWRSPGEGTGNLLSCLGNPMDNGTWQTTVHGVTKELDMSERLNNCSFSWRPLTRFSLYRVFIIQELFLFFKKKTLLSEFTFKRKPKLFVIFKWLYKILSWNMMQNYEHKYNKF